MKIKNRISKPNIEFENVIREHLISCGVDDPDAWLNAEFKPEHKRPKDKNTKAGIKLLKEAIDFNAQISVLCDSDMDGICSASIMCDFLKKHNAAYNLITHKGKEHGITKSVFDNAIEYGTQLLIVPDAGTNKDKNAAALRDIGCDILAIDHHKPTGENDCAVVVNPCCGNIDITNTALSGAGVTDAFLRLYCDEYGEIMPYYTDIVAVSIVSDVCSVKGLDNIALLRTGLNKVENDFLKYLYMNIGRGDVSARTIGWRIAPIANALTRIESADTGIFVGAFLGEVSFTDAIREARSAKKEQTDKLIAMSEQFTPKKLGAFEVCIVDSESAPFTGLYANKILGETKAPTLVLRQLDNGNLSGSLRSPVPAMNKLNETGVCKVMGHEAAAGFIIDKAKLQEFFAWSANQDWLQSEPIEEYTCDIDISKLRVSLVEYINKSARYMCNDVPEPTFRAVLKNPQIDIFKKSTNTVRLTYEGVSFLIFRASDDTVMQFDEANGKDVDVECIVSLTTNEYRGFKYIQAIISKFEIHNNELDWDEIFK